jgi:hypothetical protein
MQMLLSAGTVDSIGKRDTAILMLAFDTGLNSCKSIL